MIWPQIHLFPCISLIIPPLCLLRYNKVILFVPTICSLLFANISPELMLFSLLKVFLVINRCRLYQFVSFILQDTAPLSAF